MDAQIANATIGELPPDVGANPRREHRIPVGIWTELPRGSRWANEGMTRLLGFLIEGVAQRKRFFFRVIVARHMYDEVIADLSSLRAAPGVDYSVHAPHSDPEEIEDTWDECVEIANSMSDIQGWLVLYPYMSHATRLNARVAAIFPDANPINFPNIESDVWRSGGPHTVWRERVAKLLKASDRVITFSQHVAEEQAEELFGVPRDRITAIPHAPPDLQHLLPFVQNRNKTSESIAKAAALLRTHAEEKGWRYLAHYPFEEIRYAVVSTQDRTSKNIYLAAEATRRLIRRCFVNLKLFTTAPVHRGALWTLFPNLLESERLEHDIVSVTDLPRDVHAALYHCAALTIHPSIFEGGSGPFPFYESVSVGTPCLMASGPHILELLRGEPDLADSVFEPHDADGLVQLIAAVLATPERFLATQRAAFERLSRRGWGDVAEAYAHAACSN